MNTFFDHKNFNLYCCIIISILGFILYSNTLGHNYALDDTLVITENNYTKEGFKGIKKIFTNDSFTGFFKKEKDLVQGGRYRPLSIATFAAEYELFGLNPFVSHLINILLYCFSGILLFIVVDQLTEDTGKKKVLKWFPIIISLLFIFHPVHTEVVANIKGRDEILALLFSLISFFYILRYLKDDKVIHLFLSFISLLCAMLSKESAITFLITIPIACYLFKKQTIRKIIITCIPLLLSAISYLVIRGQVIGIKTISISNELMNNPFVNATNVERFATIFYTLGYYIKLLIIPHPLTFDYYPYHIQLQNLISIPVILSLTVYLLLAFSAIYFRKNTWVTFSILYFLINIFLVSNVFFVIGTFMNERFLYIPSLGFCFMLTYLIISFSEKLKIKKIHIFILIILIIIIIPYSIKTILRNKTWKDDFTLFTTDVKTSFNSAKSTCSAGGILYETSLTLKDEKQKKEYLKTSIEYLNRSVEIHPYYINALLLLGNAHYTLNQDMNKVLEYYLRILKINPDYNEVYTNLDIMLSSYRNTDHKIEIYLILLEYFPGNYSFNYQLGHIYGRYKNDISKSIQYLNYAHKINPQKKEVCKDMGVAHGTAGDFKKSLIYLQEALAIDPNDIDLIQNIGITYYRMGNMTMANEYFSKINRQKHNLQQNK